ncbi:arylesterase [Noviherbaspirillum suwonense]|uniref:Acyl-CoA thioesterase-1 n=1 Tax=Noviherbaspirillum suwonense TaxID=1224511 RepID=A0ABY1PVT2_9BURK|nr:arylesterase [Noviherbaspirillum suwonense]SMP49926.1 acyl-CoA thioesterase-1 [Noviherbaspirillum suwonense]
MLVKTWRALVLVICMLGATASAHSASKTLLVLGDSLSAEYGLARGSGWVPLLEKRLKADRLDVRVVNASISGDTTSGGRARLQPLLERHKPDVLVLELGANDALRGLPVASTEGNLRAIIESAKKVGTTVLLVGMQIPPNYGGEYATRFAGLFPKLAKEHQLPLVPFFLAPLLERPDLFQGDRLHPTAEAQPLLLDAVWPKLQPLLAR